MKWFNQSSLSSTNSRNAYYGDILDNSSVVVLEQLVSYKIWSPHSSGLREWLIMMRCSMAYSHGHVMRRQQWDLLTDLYCYHGWVFRMEQTSDCFSLRLCSSIVRLHQRVGIRFESPRAFWLLVFSRLLWPAILTLLYGPGYRLSAY